MSSPAESQVPAPTTTADLAALQNLPPLHSPDRRNGKVARLPKPTRDRINVMLQDGVPYADIIQRLGPEAQHLTEMNLSNWKGGGYLDWLRHMDLLEAMHRKHELAQSIVQESSKKIAASQGLLQVIAGNVCEFLIETDPATLRESLLSDADKFTRFVNSMVRLAEGSIKCELHNFHTEDREAEAVKHSSTESRGVSEESLHTAEQKLSLM